MEGLAAGKIKGLNVLAVGLHERLQGIGLQSTCGITSGSIRYKTEVRASGSRHLKQSVAGIESTVLGDVLDVTILAVGKIEGVAVDRRCAVLAALNNGRRGRPALGVCSINVNAALADDRLRSRSAGDMKTRDVTIAGERDRPGLVGRIGGARARKPIVAIDVRVEGDGLERQVGSRLASNMPGKIVFMRYVGKAPKMSAI